MGTDVRARRSWIGIVAAVAVTVVACAPPAPVPAPVSAAPTTTTATPPTTATTAVPTTVLPATEPLVCPGSSAGAATDETVPIQVEDPLDAAELFAATIDAANEAIAEPASENPAITADGGPAVSITSVVDGIPVTDTVVVSESLGAAADASLAGDVVAVEAASTVSTLEDPDAGSGVLASNDSLRGDLWVFDALEFERSWQCGTGGGVSVAVVDSGVLGTHPDLVARVTPGWTKLTADPGTVGGGNVDPHGHGTHVAGTIGAVAGNSIGIAGVAPDVTIVPVRVLDAAGEGLNANVAAGITWAVGQGVDVINLSLGSAARSAAVETAVAHAVANGVVVIAAAGNEGENDSPTIYPAAFEDTIAVAAITPSLAVAAYSNRGAYLDVAAPGSGIVSTFNNGGYASISGTSMAAPHVAGLAAVLLSVQGGLTPAQLRTRLTTSADDAGAAGFDHEYGWGIINPVRALTGSG